MPNLDLNDLLTYSGCEIMSIPRFDSISYQGQGGIFILPLNLSNSPYVHFKTMSLFKKYSDKLSLTCPAIACLAFILV